MAVLGVDACRTGWAGIVLDGGNVHGLHDLDFGRLVAAAAALAPLTAVGVDMPIGLPDRGTRAADLLARAAIGPRRSSVFLTPVRAALQEPTYAEALRRNQEVTGAGISRQAYGLRGHILTVEDYARTATLPVLEVHPELSFTVLAGTHLAAGKKTWAGAARRRGLLAAAGVVIPDELGQVGGLAAVDDVLDAAVAAWSARRFSAGRARCYPDPPEVFADGLPAAIWA